MIKTLVRGWVYTIKDDPDNPIYKAFSITKGYKEAYGTDYFKTSPPTGRMESFTILM